ncbi:SIR2 family protein [Heyndrickxia sp. FSL K6-6286]|uniref:SIR2 family protein n=1 Tax=Heyndrickxia sp. FSL K6-6286 TaxID=2921510 RepID=UPI00315ACE70
MSLKQLIHTVSLKLKISEEQTIEKLNIIAEIVKNEIFYKERLTHYDIGDLTGNVIINELLREGMASKYLSYECEVTDSVDFAIALSEKCNHCGEELADSPTHIIREAYTLNKPFLELIGQQKKEQLKKYIIEDYRSNLDRLKNRTHKIIPFLGAGVSIPFKLPSWKNLLLQLDKGLNETNREKYIDLIQQGDYLKALSFLKIYSGLYQNEQTIKKDIKSIIKSSYIKEPNNTFHNILDILKLDTQFIITTNYDNIVSDYLKDYRGEFVMPQNLDTLDDLQDLMEEDTQKVIHLHGNADMYNSMIVTEDDYNKLYREEKIKDVLNGIMSNKTLLFIGFSFKDQYFKDLYDKIYAQIKGEHFIIIENLHPFDAAELLKRNLIPIGINVDKEEENSFVKAIRTVLEELY